MSYLWIPIIAFLISAVFAWIVHSLWPSQLQWLGKLDDLEKLLSSFLTESPVERTLNLSVQRHRARIWVDFMDDHITIRFPLVTKALLHRKEELVGEIEAICGQAKMAGLSAPKKSPIIEGSTPIASPEKLAEILRTIVKLVYRTADDATIRYVMTARSGNAAEVKKLAKTASNTNAFKNVFLTYDNIGEEFKQKQRNGCLLESAQYLLVPVVFIFAFYRYGFYAAIVVHIGLSIFVFTWNTLRGEKGWTELSNLFWLVGIGFALLTYFTGNFFFIQFGTTVLFILAAIRMLYAFACGEPLIGKASDGRSQFSGTGTIARNIGMILLLIAGAGFNEFLRIYGSLETWVWFYAFKKLGIVLLGSSVTIPLAFYASKED